MRVFVSARLHLQRITFIYIYIYQAEQTHNESRNQEALDGQLPHAYNQSFAYIFNVISYGYSFGICFCFFLLLLFLPCRFYHLTSSATSYYKIPTTKRVYCMYVCVCLYDGFQAEIHFIVKLFPLISNTRFMCVFIFKTKQKKQTGVDL